MFACARSVCTTTCVQYHCQSADGPVDTHAPLLFRSLSRSPSTPRALSHFYFPLCMHERSATVRTSVSGLQNMVTRVVGRHSKSRPCRRSFWSSHPAGACFPCRRLLSEPAAASFAEDDQSRPTRWPGPRPAPTPWSTTRLPRLHAMRGAALAHLIHHAPLWKRSTSLQTTAQLRRPRVPQTPTPHSDMSTYKK